MFKRQSTIQSLLNRTPNPTRNPSLMSYNFALNDLLFKGSIDLPLIENHRFSPTNHRKKGGIRVNRKPTMLNVNSCFDSYNKTDQKARALASHQQLVRETGLRDDLYGGGVLVNGRPAEFEKIVVAVDVDEVLGNFLSALNRFIADHYSMNHSVSEYHVYEFFKIWNISRDEADIRVHEFFKTPYFKKGIHPLPGARQALHRLSIHCDLAVVTSRQYAIKDHTIEWIEKYFPGLFKEIHFGNHFALDGESKPKSEICRSLGAKILIDDNPRYAMECAEVGIKVLLFDYENSYPWSKTDSSKQHPLITKVRNWEEVEHQIASAIVS